MSMEQRDGNCHKMSQVGVKCREIVVALVANCRDIFFPSPSRRPLLVFADRSNYGSAAVTVTFGDINSEKSEIGR